MPKLSVSAITKFNYTRKVTAYAVASRATGYPQVALLSRPIAQKAGVPATPTTKILTLRRTKCENETFLFLSE